MSLVVNTGGTAFSIVILRLQVAFVGFGKGICIENQLIQSIQPSLDQGN